MIGKYFKRDVALIEDNISIKEFEKPDIMEGLLESFIQFSEGDIESINNVSVEHIELKGTRLEPGVFHISEGEVDGVYMLNLKVNDEKVDVELKVLREGNNDVSLNYGYELGKNVIERLPESEAVLITFAGDKTVNVKVNGGYLHLIVEFDTLGVTNMTWFGKYEFKSETKEVTDIEKWSKINTNIDQNQWRYVAYGNSVFVAIDATDTGTQSRIAYSEDNGKTWTKISSNVTDSIKWELITYGNNVFIIAGYDFSNDTHKIAYSEDNGKTWQYSTGITDKKWNCIAYGNGLFVIGTRSGTNRIGYSEDNGKTWKQIDYGNNYSGDNMDNNNWTSITYGNGVFVAVAYDNTNRVAWSTDGKNWHKITYTGTGDSMDNDQWRGITYGEDSLGNKTFVAVSYAGSHRIAYSPNDGKEWHVINDTDISSNYWYSVAYGNGVFVTIGGTDDETIKHVAYSTNNGRNWSLIDGTEMSNNVWDGIAFGNGTFVATGMNGDNRIAYSTDNGQTWTKSINSDMDNNSWRDIAYGNNTFVAVAKSGTYKAAWSTNGQNWSLTNNNVMDNNNWWGVAYGNNTFVAVAGEGARGVAWSTNNGQNWTRINNDDMNGIFWCSIAFGNGIFVAVGSGSTAWSTNNGQTWSLVTDNVNNATWESVTFGNNTFVAVAGEGARGVAWSTNNGQNWTRINNDDMNGNYWAGIAYGNGTFLAVSISGTGKIAYSTDNGQSWTKFVNSDIDENSWNGITFSNNTFVAASNSATGKIAYSTDNGRTWSLINNFTNQIGWSKIASNYNTFVAVSTSDSINTNKVAYTELKQITTDYNNMSYNQILKGVNSSILNSSNWRSIAYGNNTFISVARNNSNRLAISTDNCQTWNLINNVAMDNITWNSIAFGNNTFVTVGYEGNNRAAYSEDNGRTWSLLSVDGMNNGAWNAVTFGNDTFVAVEFGSVAYSTNNGKNWTRYSNTAMQHNYWYSVAYGNNTFVTIGVSGDNRVAYSTDNGQNWSLIDYNNYSGDNMDNNSWHSITYGEDSLGNKTFVAVGTSGDNRVAYSEDNGRTWYKITDINMDNNNWQSVAYGNNTFVAVTYNGEYRVAYSEDNGRTWHKIRDTNMDNNGWELITYANNMFIAIGGNSTNRVAYSVDGKTWVNKITFNPFASLTFTSSNEPNEVKTINNIEISKLTLTVTNNTPATEESNGSLTISAFNILLSKISGTLGDNSIFELENVHLNIASLSNTITLNTKYVFNRTDKILLCGSSSNVSLNGSTTTISNITINAPSLNFTASDKPRLFINSTTYESIDELKSIGSNIYSTPLNSVFGNRVGFEDVNEEMSAYLSSGIAFYSNLPVPYYDVITNFSSNAGFEIPIESNGSIASKYVRISDLYNKNSTKTQVPDLADRLHSIEVSKQFVTNDIIESNNPIAHSLLATKEKYQELDISSLL